MSDEPRHSDKKTESVIELLNIREIVADEVQKALAEMTDERIKQIMKRADYLREQEVLKGLSVYGGKGR